MIFDGKPYAVSISEGEIDAEGNVHLDITFRALFGNRSVCLVRGVTNRSYWQDYPAIDEMRARAVSVTPKVAYYLVRIAHARGWNPETCKSNFEMNASKADIRYQNDSADR